MWSSRGPKMIHLIDYRLQHSGEAEADLMTFQSIVNQILMNKNASACKDTYTYNITIAQLLSSP